MIMKKTPPNYITALFLCVIGLSFISMTKKDKWIQLFNGKDLTGWDTYIGPDLDNNGQPINDKPVGLNNDPKKVFTISRENGENIIRISGENWGAITTKKAYGNYHLQLQFKWGSLLWGQKKGKHKDSGLLYHSVGKYGADGGAWMRSQEFQIEESNCGDYWGCAGAMADIPADKKSETTYVYNPKGIIYEFSQQSKQGRHCAKQGDDEKPTGEWNTLDLYTHGDTSIHVVNGKVAMVLYHNRQFDNGKIIPLTEGKIQIQSEGSEVYFKHIQIQPIHSLPIVLLNQ
jgi:hypothetical protein